MERPISSSKSSQIRKPDRNLFSLLKRKLNFFMLPKQECFFFNLLVTQGGTLERLEEM